MRVTDILSWDFNTKFIGEEIHYQRVSIFWITTGWLRDTENAKISTPRILFMFIDTLH